MAKAVARLGNLKIHGMDSTDQESSIAEFMNQFYAFVDDYRKNTQRLSSFILILNQEMPYQDFELRFWNFLTRIHALDKKRYSHDPRVSSDPDDPEFSFSLKEEAFFILALHPDSPRLSRRFSFPTIVFNPHQQFELLRKRGIFKKVRDLIRQRDKILQGYANPMLNDFGEKSELYQYMGRIYSETEIIPFHVKGYDNESDRTTSWSFIQT